jgi:hypothetical protein
MGAPINRSAASEERARMAALDHPNLIAALDAGRGSTHQGFTFVVGEGEEELLSWDRLRAEAMNRAAHLRALGLRTG